MSRLYLDFKAVRERASFLGVLDRYHVQLKKVAANQYKANCPLPSHSNATESGTFGVNIDRNIFKCFSDSCRKAGNGSQGNVIDFVAAMEGVQAYDAAAKLNEWYPNGLTKVADAQDPGATETTGNRPLAFQLKDVNPEHPMIQSRNITVETARTWGVGFFPGKGSMMGRIVFPLHQGGKLIGYAGRSTLEGQEPKWLLGKGLVKSFLYGLERCDPVKPLVVAESTWAVLYFYQNGAQAAALMGSEMTAEQEKCLAPFGVITVALDNDTAGNEKAAPIVDRLKAAGHKVLKARLME
jgi:DNA primase